MMDLFDKLQTSQLVAFGIFLITAIILISCGFYIKFRHLVCGRRSKYSLTIELKRITRNNVAGMGANEFNYQIKRLSDGAPLMNSVRPASADPEYLTALNQLCFHHGNTERRPSILNQSVQSLLKSVPVGPRLDSVV